MLSSQDKRAVRELRRKSTSQPQAVASKPVIGLFGRLGSGNIGNDATLEAVLAYLGSHYPGALLDCMCSGPDRIRERYHVAAIQLHWFDRDVRPRNRWMRLAAAGVGVGLGLFVDAWRTASWVRRHHVVIVPGMGVLESTLAQRPWQLPYSMFLLSLFGRLFRTRVALLCVGVSDMPRGPTRWLLTAAANGASYRSFRDIYSLEEARRLGISGSRDEVYPDLVFSLPDPVCIPAKGRHVGVGVMDYSGASSDSKVAERIQSDYVDTMVQFTRWLVDTGHEVRLLIGDGDDESVANTVLDDVRSRWVRPGPPPIAYQPISTIRDLTDQVAPLDAVVATRYHNVLVALKCCKPTLCIGYAKKHHALMTEAGQEQFNHHIDDLDVDQLKETFLQLSANSAQISATLDHHKDISRVRLDEQFDRLTEVLTAAFDQRPVGESR